MFSNVKTITIPEGAVAKIEYGGVTLWERPGALPSAYQQVEWVRAGKDVDAYIKLGFTFDTAARFKIGLYDSGVFSYGYPFGAAENSGKLRCMISAPYNADGTAVLARLYGSNGSSFIGVDVKLVNGLNELECTMKLGLIRIYNKTNNTEGSAASQATYTMTNELYLLAQNYNGSPRFGYIRQISYFEYYDKNDELICSLTPCYRKSDGVIGMYDTVRNQFLTNAGTGSFTNGPNVN